MSLLISLWCLRFVRPEPVSVREIETKRITLHSNFLGCGLLYQPTFVLGRFYMCIWSDTAVVPVNERTIEGRRWRLDLCPEGNGLYERVGVFSLRCRFARRNSRFRFVFLSRREKIRYRDRLYIMSPVQQRDFIYLDTKLPSCLAFRQRYLPSAAQKEQNTR